MGRIKLFKANLIKDYQGMLETKFGDHPSISYVEADVLMYFYFEV
jgi:hypothetical protein